jgi:thiosulfate/3-mercaptopyruvate sulfurtransferase
MDSLVSTDWLAGELEAKDLRIVDATYVLAADGRDPHDEFDTAHIPHAVFFDIAEVSDTSSSLPTMLPSAAKFASRMQALGLGDGNRVVVYDNSPYHTAARAWWMLKLFGAYDVAILDGGFAKWRAEGRAVESGRPIVRHRHFTVWDDRSGVRDLAQMKDNLKTRAEQVVDTRSGARFRGEEPEMRPGVQPGHIPGSLNLPQGELFAADGTWKRGDALKAAFQDAGIDLAKPMVTTCGSGITAAVVAFGAHLLGKSDVALYDGSWSEWGGDPSTPKVTGAA